jgi:hypothetical protein
MKTMKTLLIQNSITKLIFGKIILRQLFFWNSAFVKNNMSWANVINYCNNHIHGCQFFWKIPNGRAIEEKHYSM